MELNHSDGLKTSGDLSEGFTSMMDDDFGSSNLNLCDPSDKSKLEAIARALESSVPVRNNRYRFKIYKNTFVGSECVDFLVRSNYASTRAEAVELGRRIANELNLFEHVKQEHELKDEFLFYRFVESGRRTYTMHPQRVSAKLESDQILLDIAERLREGLDVRDRTFRLKRYRQCLVAS